MVNSQTPEAAHARLQSCRRTCTVVHDGAGDADRPGVGLDSPAAHTHYIEDDFTLECAVDTFSSNGGGALE